jgi:hypothetical protein
MRERTNYRAQETKPGRTISGSCTRVAPAVSAVEASIVIWRHGRGGQCNCYGRSQVSRPGSRNLRAALGIQTKVFALRNLYTFQAGFDFLFDPIGRNHLMEHDAELPVAIQPASAAHLQYCASDVASLGKKQLTGNYERLADDRLDRLAFLRRSGT